MCKRPLNKQVWTPGERPGLRPGWELKRRAWGRVAREKDHVREKRHMTESGMMPAGEEALFLTQRKLRTGQRCRKKIRRVYVPEVKETGCFKKEEVSSVTCFSEAKQGKE